MKMCLDRKKYLDSENSRTIPSPHNDPDIQIISSSASKMKIQPKITTPKPNISKITPQKPNISKVTPHKPKITPGFTPKNNFPTSKPRTRKVPENNTKINYKGLDEKLAQKILNELVTLRKSNGDNFNSIAGNTLAKKALEETV